MITNVYEIVNRDYHEMIWYKKSYIDVFGIVSFDNLFHKLLKKTKVACLACIFLMVGVTEIHFGWD